MQIKIKDLKYSCFKVYCKLHIYLNSVKTIISNYEIKMYTVMKENFSIVLTAVLVLDIFFSFHFLAISLTSFCRRKDMQKYVKN